MFNVPHIHAVHEGSNCRRHATDTLITNEFLFDFAENKVGELS